MDNAPTQKAPRKRKVLLAAGMAAVVAGIGAAASVSFADADNAAAAGFSDTFEDGDTAGWSKSGGAWSVVSDDSKVLRQTKTGATLARQFAGLTGWTDYTVTADVEPIAVASGGYAGIVARSTSSTSFYRLALTGAGKVRLESVKSGTATVLDEAALTVSKGTSYTLGLTVSGTGLTGSVNGASVLAATSTSFTKGQIGLQTYDATAQFDNVAVTTGAAAPTATATTKPAATATAKPTATATTKPATAAPTTAVPSSAAPTSAVPTSAVPTSAAPGSGAFESSPIGFGAGTTGGAGGTTVKITSLDQLITEAKSDGKKVLQLSSVLKGSGTDTVVVSSDKTIVGVGANAGLTGAGIFIKKASNVIVRNLKISFAQAPVDLIATQKSDHIWVDHNELFNDTSHDKDFYDGMLDLTHATDFVTASWNYLHDHAKGSLIGHSDNNAAEDTGTLHITYSHNWFDNVASRLPRVRFGTVHLYNNLFTNAKTSGIHCLMDSRCLVQNNVFVGVKLPVWTTEDSDRDGFAVATGNDFGGEAPVITQAGTFTKAPYAVTLDPAASVSALVKAGVGTGKI
ncbi:polysaccharide lyase family 1 protein [Actinoplanes sp. NPDC051494]|uniref:polysaccharide lyase family 1 protein n=1 Tax=Actinoplanes sp. NPDC051494 TaxID=3363907 RepID=UPI00378F1A41